MKIKIDTDDYRHYVYDNVSLISYSTFAERPAIVFDYNHKIEAIELSRISDMKIEK